MKASEFLGSELNNILRVFSPRQIYSFRDKSDDKTVDHTKFEEDDMILVQYKSKEEHYNERTHQYEYVTVIYRIPAIVKSFKDKGSCVHWSTVRFDGVGMYFDDFEVFSVNHLNISRETYINIVGKYEAEQKAKKEAERKARLEAERLARLEEEQERKEKEERERKAKEEHEKWLAQENDRRSQIMTITVGEWEDLLAEVEALKSVYDNL